MTSRWPVLVARISGAVLVASAALKAFDLRETASSFTDYFGLMPGLAIVLVALLCAGELGVGVWGVVRPRRAAPVLMVVFAVFAGWHIGMAVMSRGEFCPCFGKLTLMGSSGPQLALAPVLVGLAAVDFAVARAQMASGRGGTRHGSPESR